MDYEQIKQDAYDKLKAYLSNRIGHGFIPNIKAIESEVRKLRKGIEVIEQAAPVFATTLEEVDKADAAIAIRQGKIQAYQEILDKYYSTIKEQ